MSKKRGLVFLGWVTLCVSLATCATVFVALASGPKIVTIEEIQDRAATMDPKEGREFELGSLGGKPVIVVTLGDCLGCSMHKADLGELRQTGGYAVVGIYKKGATLDAVHEKHPWLKTQRDDSGLHSRLNAYFTPRVYAFDAFGRLIALQQPGEPLERFLVRLGGKL